MESGTSVLSADDIFHLAVASVRDALLYFLTFLDNNTLYLFDLVVMTQHVTAQTVSKIMCRLPNKAHSPTHSSVFSSFRTVILAPFRFRVFPPQQR